jgi:saccharopine dehydrogenase (NADP+, L-glutamate forming)
VVFTSYCGGLPAVPNDFRYRFSGAPRGVLSALCSPARVIEHGQVRDVRWPWEATTAYRLDGERFEVYPNRDSLPYVRQYDLPAAWEPDTFVRGTLRLAGWRAAWAEVFATLRAGDPACVDALAADLAARYPLRPGDTDRVVLSVELGVETTGASWHERYLLDVVGDARESAMARAVSVPLAYAVRGVLDGGTPAGLHRALPDPADAERFLAVLRDQDLDCVRTSSTGGAGVAATPGVCRSSTSTTRSCRRSSGDA